MRIGLQFFLAGLILCLWSVETSNRWAYGLLSTYLDPMPKGATPERPFAMDNPDQHVLIIYLNGSGLEEKPDACIPRPGVNVPPIAADIARQTVGEYRLSVYVFCTPAKIGGYAIPDGDGEPKVRKRAQDLARLLSLAADQGFPADRVFIMGQSAGAWAGLLVQSDEDQPVAGLIGFAPAFSGTIGARKQPWQEERYRQIDEIKRARRIDALIYGFIGDPYEPPEAMAWLMEMPGVSYQALSGRTINGVHCDNKFPHSTVFKDCFRESQIETVLSFIAERLAQTAD